MRRTPLKRKTPLKKTQLKRTVGLLFQKSGLKPFSQLKGKKGLNRNSHFKKRSKAINQVSLKRKEEGAEYSKLRKQFLKEHPKCEVCLIRTAVERVDVKTATQVHHKAGRGRFYLRVDTWLAVCHNHHEQITNNRKWAESCGFSLTVAQRREL